MALDDLGRLTAIAARQHGVVSVAQAAEVGIDRRRLNRLRAAGLLVRLQPDAFAMAAPPPGRWQAVWAAVLQLGPPSTASHESSLHAHGVTHVPFAPAVSVAPGGPHSGHGIRIHRVCDLLPSHVTEVDGLPVTTLERSVVDVASVLSRRWLEDLVDRLTIRDRRTSIGALARTLRQVNRRGRLHVGRLEVVLDARMPGEPAPRSKLERDADLLLARSLILPAPLCEHPLPGRAPGPGLVDRAWPEAGLIFEIDGRRWHSREADMAHDRARDRAAAAAGWLTLRVLDEEVHSVGEAVLVDIEQTYLSRIGRFAPTLP